MKLRNILLLFLAFILMSIFYYYSETTIYIIRHGEKVVKKGMSDAPLTDNGKIQAQKLGEFLSSKKQIPHLYASPMRRARETAEIMVLVQKMLFMGKKVCSAFFPPLSGCYPKQILYKLFLR